MSGTIPDDVTITTGGKIIGGWQAVRITRGIERMPSDFDIALTELYPSAADQIVIQPGASCVVKL
ncbi:MAG: phage baseplate assembly protein, partial [Janthinobacterium lividum]